MINLLLGLLGYYDVDIMDSLSYFIQESNDSVECFIGGGDDSSIDSDNSGSNGSNTSNCGNTSNSGDSSKEDKETLDNDIEKPVGGIPPVGGKGSSDNGGDSPYTGVTSNDYSYPVRTDISYLFRWIVKTGVSTALASITPLWENIYRYSDLISRLGEANPYSILYIGCGIASAILISIKTGFPHGCIYYIKNIAYYTTKFVRFINKYWASRFYVQSMCIMCRVPTFTIHNLSDLSNGLEKGMLAKWFDTPTEKWFLKEGHLFRLSTFKRLRRFLGMKRNIQFNKDTLNLCNLKLGVKSLSDKEVITHLVEVRILTYCDTSRKYVWGMLYILVTLGVGVIVWYKFLPGINAPILLPELFTQPDSYEPFKNPYAFVEGYKKVTYFIRKDQFKNIVIPSYYEEPPMDNLLPPIIIQNKSFFTPHYASISTAITIASYIVYNTLIHGTRIIQL